MVKPQHAKGDYLMKRCGRKATDRRIPHEIRIGNGFDIEDEKRPGHRLKLPEKRQDRPC